MENIVNRKRQEIFNQALKIIREHSDKNLFVDAFDTGKNTDLREILEDMPFDDLHKSTLFKIIGSAHYTGNQHESISTQDLNLMPDKEIIGIFSDPSIASYLEERAYAGYNDNETYDSKDNDELIRMYDYNYGTIPSYVYKGYHEHVAKYNPESEFNEIEINNKRYTPLVASFIENNKIDELTNGIFSDTHTQNGRPESFGGIPAPSRKNVNIHITRKLLSTLTGEYYPLLVVRDLVEDQSIQAIPHEHSEHYINTIGKDRVKAYSDFIAENDGLPSLHMSNQDLFKELLPELSVKESLGVLNLKLGDLAKAVASYNHFSEHSISYSAAHALTNSGKLKVSLENTPAYLNKLDNDYSPTSKKTIRQHQVGLEFETKTYENGDKIDVLVELESDAFGLYDNLEDAITKVHYAELKEWVNRGDSISLSYEYLDKSELENLTSSLKKAFNDFIKDKPLVGDVITISIDEDKYDYYEDTDIKDGDKYLVTSVISNYNDNPSLKLKGSHTTVDAEDTVVSRKLKLTKSLEQEVTL